MLSFSVITILCWWVSGYKHEVAWILSWYFATFKTFCLKKGEGAFITAGAFNTNNTVFLYLAIFHNQYFRLILLDRNTNDKITLIRVQVRWTGIMSHHFSTSILPMSQHLPFFAAQYGSFPCSFLQLSYPVSMSWFRLEFHRMIVRKQQRVTMWAVLVLHFSTYIWNLQINRKFVWNLWIDVLNVQIIYYKAHVLPESMGNESTLLSVTVQCDSKYKLDTFFKVTFLTNKMIINLFENIYKSWYLERI